MKKISNFCTYFLIILNSAFGFEVMDRWSHRFEKETVVKCADNEYSCDDFCGNKVQCIIKERVCRDCVGSTVYLTHIFDQIGRSIVNSDETVPDELFDFLKTKKFNSISSKSVYNVMDGVGDTDLAKRFLSLCPEGSTNPLMIFEVQDVSMLLGRPKFLICNQGENTKIYHVDFTGGVTVIESR